MSEDKPEASPLHSEAVSLNSERALPESSSSAPQVPEPSTQSVSPPKPIDRWLGIAGIAVGIAFSLLPKTPSVVVICTVIMFGLLVHPLVNFWWIEHTRLRKLTSAFILAMACFFIGYASWPSPAIPPLTAKDVADELERRNIHKADKPIIVGNPVPPQPESKSAAIEQDRRVAVVKPASKALVFHAMYVGVGNMPERAGVVTLNDKPWDKDAHADVRLTITNDLDLALQDLDINIDVAEGDPKVVIAGIAQLTKVSGLEFQKPTFKSPAVRLKGQRWEVIQPSA
jgi:hypothetical protein